MGEKKARRPSSASESDDDDVTTTHVDTSDTESDSVSIASSHTDDRRNRPQEKPAAAVQASKAKEESSVPAHAAYFGTTEDCCSICLDDFDKGNPATTLPCKHEFHLQCLFEIVEWKRTTCPMCWTEFETDVIGIPSQKKKGRARGGSEPSKRRSKRPSRRSRDRAQSDRVSHRSHPSTSAMPSSGPQSAPSSYMRNLAHEYRSGNANTRISSRDDAMDYHRDRSSRHRDSHGRRATQASSDSETEANTTGSLLSCECFTPTIFRSGRGNNNSASGGTKYGFFRRLFCLPPPAAQVQV
eukprot:GFYU01020722.1.p1 GENE.GFYU01020722.1~~GFYU01020722.1.p1  ORF type:complete len:298 (-),score=55.04 GFYU01020722.1:35-928(-)